MAGLLTNRDLSKEDDFYELLGCDENSTTEQIAMEFKQLARKYHPDKEHNQECKDKAEKMFVRLEAAKAVLLDKETRLKYDQWRSGGFQRVISFKEWLAIQSKVHSSIHWATPQKKLPSLPEPEKAATSDASHNEGPEPSKRHKIDSSIDDQKPTSLQQFRKGTEDETPSPTDKHSVLAQFRNYNI